jgi:hypothetical protein
MAFVYNVNKNGITLSQAFLQLISTLVSAGWTVLGSGDGTSGHYSSTGNIIYHGYAAAYGWRNVGAWIRIQSPVIPATGQKREFIFQCGSATGLSIRIKYSPNVTGTSGGFTGGSPAAAQTPSAADQIYVAGGGTEASPTYQTWAGSFGDLQFACNVVADTGALNYAWYMCVVNASSGLSNGPNMMMDTLEPGTYDPNDTDPCVVYWASSSTSGYGAELTSANVFGFMGAIASANWLNVQLTPGYYNSALYNPAAGGSNAWSNKDVCTTVSWAYNTNPFLGFKGVSQLLRTAPTPRDFPHLMKINPNALGDCINQKGTLLPWPTSTPVFVP